MVGLSSDVSMEGDSYYLTTRSIKDPVHDSIKFDTFIWSFIDTRQYQRLRDIKQLGVSYYVWPGASHNRFEHGIGVAYLAEKLVRHLQRLQPELGITERDVRCVTLAGLCHDLGHGPWSHVWDGLFIPSISIGSTWTHEDASEMMFDDLVRSNNIDIDEDDVNFIKDLIQGKSRLSAYKKSPEKKFLFDIVANKRNGIDVDKFDYIARDVRAIGDHNNFTAQRLIDSARVIDDEICYNIKDANQLYELCQLRFSNHKRIYSHKTARAIEFMLVDALKAAEPAMKIANRIEDPKQYLFLTDNIKAWIMQSDNPDLSESQAILERIETRDLYSCVDWYVGRYEQQAHFRSRITPEVIVQTAKRKFLNGSFHEGGSGPSREDVESLKADHVIVDVAVIHHGMKDKCPLDFICFYSKLNIKEKKHAETGELSTLMPSSFAEFQLRIFTKDKRYFGIVQDAYREVFRTCLEGLDPGLSIDSSSLTPPLTEAPSTPPTLSSQSPPNSRKSSFASIKTPNKFTTVSPSYAPASPLRSATRMGPTRSLDRIPTLDNRAMGSGSALAGSAFESRQIMKTKTNAVASTIPEESSGMVVDEENLVTPKKRGSIQLGSPSEITMGGFRRSTRKRPLDMDGSPSKDPVQEGMKPRRLR